jgi:hypothetical protein
MDGGGRALVGLMGTGDLERGNRSRTVGLDGNITKEQEVQATQVKKIIVGISDIGKLTQDLPFRKSLFFLHSFRL